MYKSDQMKGVVFWQWANQSVNVAVNYANANKTTPMNLRETVALTAPTAFPRRAKRDAPLVADPSVAYVAAVTASVSIALGLSEGVKRLPPRIGPTTRMILSRLVPFAAVAGAGTVNVFMMRLK
ncbi:MAG: hypothetical protein BJ554DRAFT_2872, partial [Olpidium bornovanus]